MLLLSGGVDSLELSTGGTQSTDWTASYVDITPTSFTPGSNQGNVVTATTTTIAAVPTASSTRQIKMLSVRNRDAAASQTVTIRKNHSGSIFHVTGAVVLATGETLYYVDGDGFYVADANGNIKNTTVSPSSIAANTILGNNTGVTAQPVGLTPAQVTVMLSVGTTDRFLRSDGTWSSTLSSTNQQLTIADPGANGAFLQFGVTNAAGYTINASYTSGSAGNLKLQTANVDRLTINATGNSTFAAPGSGIAVTVTGLQGTNTLFQGPNTGAGWNVQFTDTTNAAARGFIGVGTNTMSGAAVTDFIVTSGASGSVQIPRANGGVAATTFGPNGNVTIAAPSSGDCFTANGVANSYAGTFVASSTASQSFGVQIKGGTNVNDYALNVVNQANTQNFLRLYGDGHFQIGYNGTGSIITGTAAGNVAIPAPSSGGALNVNAVASNTAVTATLASTGSGAVAFNATDGGSTANYLLQTLTANFSSTGTAAPVLTANKPGAGTAILTWFRVVANGTLGWVPVWAN